MKEGRWSGKGNPGKAITSFGRFVLEHLESKLIFTWFHYDYFLNLILNEGMGLDVYMEIEAKLEMWYW